jgi:hypothetical protein
MKIIGCWAVVNWWFCANSAAERGCPVPPGFQEIQPCIALTTQLHQVNNLTTQLLKAKESTETIELKSILAQNNAATYAKQYEENEHIVNEIYYNEKLDTTHTVFNIHHLVDTKKQYLVESGNLSILKSIAAQCPFEGGNAVFAARAMLSAYDSTYYNDRLICLNRGILWRTQKTASRENTKRFNIQILPKPCIWVWHTCRAG